MRVVLIATYELGRQPFGLASPAAWLRGAGHDVTMCDVSREPIASAMVEGAGLVAFHLPMHTATRLAVPLVGQVRERAPGAHLCAFGLYARPNEPFLRERGIHTILGPEYEADLLSLADALHAATPVPPRTPGLPRLPFRLPDREGLPPLDTYARFADASGATRVAGATEASRGCKHLCTHCPIVRMYQGQFRVVPVDVVLADVAQQVAKGATHITFGDPDFFNGVTHAMRIVEGLAARHPGLTYDVTIKVEHLLAHRAALATLVDTGCAFVTSAFESFDDDVLVTLAKGHTRADAEEVVAHAQRIGLPIAPTFVAFTPWTTTSSYAAFLETIAAWRLVGAVSPMQLALRLLLPSGSPLSVRPDIAPLLRGFDPEQLAHRWAHADPAIDELQRQVMAVVTAPKNRSRRQVFEAVVACVAARGVSIAATTDGGRPRAVAIATVDEPWYC